MGVTDVLGDKAANALPQGPLFGREYARMGGGLECIFCRPLGSIGIDATSNDPWFIFDSEY